MANNIFDFEILGQVARVRIDTDTRAVIFAPKSKFNPKKFNRQYRLEHFYQTMQPFKVYAVWQTRYLDLEGNEEPLLRTSPETVELKQWAENYDSANLGATWEKAVNELLFSLNGSCKDVFAEDGNFTFTEPVMFRVLNMGVDSIEVEGLSGARDVNGEFRCRIKLASVADFSSAPIETTIDGKFVFTGLLANTDYDIQFLDDRSPVATSRVVGVKTLV